MVIRVESPIRLNSEGSSRVKKLLAKTFTIVNERNDDARLITNIWSCFHSLFQTLAKAQIHPVQLKLQGGQFRKLVGGNNNPRDFDFKLTVNTSMESGVAFDCVTAIFLQVFQCTLAHLKKHPFRKVDLNSGDQWMSLTLREKEGSDLDFTIERRMNRSWIGLDDSGSLNISPLAIDPSSEPILEEIYGTHPHFSLFLLKENASIIPQPERLHDLLFRVVEKRVKGIDLFHDGRLEPLAVSQLHQIYYDPIRFHNRLSNFLDDHYKTKIGKLAFLLSFLSVLETYSASLSSVVQSHINLLVPDLQNPHARLKFLLDFSKRIDQRHKEATQTLSKLQKQFHSYPNVDTLFTFPPEAEIQDEEGSIFRIILPQNLTKLYTAAPLDDSIASELFEFYRSLILKTSFELRSTLSASLLELASIHPPTQFNLDFIKTLCFEKHHPRVDKIRALIQIGKKKGSPHLEAFLIIQAGSLVAKPYPKDLTQNEIEAFTTFLTQLIERNRTSSTDEFYYFITRFHKRFPDVPIPQREDSLSREGSDLSSEPFNQELERQSQLDEFFPSEAKITLEEFTKDPIAAIALIQSKEENELYAPFAQVIRSWLDEQEVSPLIEEAIYEIISKLEGKEGWVNQTEHLMVLLHLFQKRNLKEIPLHTSSPRKKKEPTRVEPLSFSPSKYNSFYLRCLDLYSSIPKEKVSISDIQIKLLRALQKISSSEDAIKLISQTIPFLSDKVHISAYRFLLEKYQTGSAICAEEELLKGYLSSISLESLKAAEPLFSYGSQLTDFDVKALVLNVVSKGRKEDLFRLITLLGSITGSELTGGPYSLLDLQTILKKKEQMSSFAARLYLSANRSLWADLVPSERSKFVLESFDENLKIEEPALMLKGAEILFEQIQSLSFTDSVENLERIVFSFLNIFKEAERDSLLAELICYIQKTAALTPFKNREAIALLPFVKDLSEKEALLPFVDPKSSLYLETLLLLPFEKAFPLFKEGEEKKSFELSLRKKIYAKMIAAVEEKTVLPLFHLYEEAGFFDLADLKTSTVSLLEKIHKFHPEGYLDILEKYIDLTSPESRPYLFWINREIKMGKWEKALGFLWQYEEITPIHQRLKSPYIALLLGAPQSTELSLLVDLFDRASLLKSGGDLKKAFLSLQSRLTLPLAHSTEEEFLNSLKWLERYQKAIPQQEQKGSFYLPFLQSIPLDCSIKTLKQVESFFRSIVKLVALPTNSFYSDRVKAPKIDDREQPSIEPIQGCSRSSIPGGFDALPSGRNLGEGPLGSDEDLAPLCLSLIESYSKKPEGKSFALTLCNEAPKLVGIERFEANKDSFLWQQVNLLIETEEIGSQIKLSSLLKQLPNSEEKKIATQKLYLKFSDLMINSNDFTEAYQVCLTACRNKIFEPPYPREFLQRLCQLAVSCIAFPKPISIFGRILFRDVSGKLETIDECVSQGRLIWAHSGSPFYRPVEKCELEEFSFGVINPAGCFELGRVNGVASVIPSIYYMENRDAIPIPLSILLGSELTLIESWEGSYLKADPLIYSILPGVYLTYEEVISLNQLFLEEVLFLFLQRHQKVLFAEFPEIQKELEEKVRDKLPAKWNQLPRLQKFLKPNGTLIPLNQ